MKLPTKWSEVSLKQYIEITEVSIIDMDELDKSVKILAILSGAKEDFFLELPLNQVKEYIRSIQFIYTNPEGGALRHTRKFGIKKYKINYKLSDITGGEYIDLTGFIKDPIKVTQNFPQILAIFFKPINWLGLNKKGCYHNGNQTVESRIETAKILYDLPMDEVAALSGFFLRSYEALTKATIQTVEKMNKKNRKNLEKLMKKEGFLSSIPGNSPLTT